MPRASIVPVAALAAFLVGTGCAGHADVARVETLREVPGVAVEVRAAARTAVDLTIRNEGPEPWRVLWEESSYVTPGGDAVRLLVESPRRIEAGVSQPPSPLPAGAEVRERCWLASGSLAEGARDDEAVGVLHLILARDGARDEWRGRLHLEGDLPEDPDF